MAKPRVFISSTFFDLRSMRASLERFVKETGYDPILFERGHIPWGKEDALESYCYREIHTCDILVAVIGGKFGTQSRSNDSSITQNEINEAYEKGKQVYLFVDKSVHSEYHTYQKNKHLEGFSPISVDNNKIFDFLYDIYNMDVGNPVEPFETVEDIIRFLKEQWAGLFQRLLTTNSRYIEAQLISDLKSSSETLSSLVAVLLKEKNNPGQVNDILMLHHPAFEAIKKSAGITYRVVFYNLEELNQLLSARGYNLDKDWSPDDAHDFDNKKANKAIRVSKDIFDAEDKLITMTPADWKTDYVKVIPLAAFSDDEIPF
ncbi:DUF4062 domain-containing protein [Pantoea sp. ARC270]|uniref:DUF4062 domain-containing protein n=1 Tax=Pantoea sp. ARC270 TaxID=2027923 RepID=UPI0011B82266|nr:DUF4062 domain-containing protein [Pantoea sp. ARC270]